VDRVFDPSGKKMDGAQIPLKPGFYLQIACPGTRFDHLRGKGVGVGYLGVQAEVIYFFDGNGIELVMRKITAIVQKFVKQLVGLLEGDRISEHPGLM